MANLTTDSILGVTRSVGTVTIRFRWTVTSRRSRGTSLSVFAHPVTLVLTDPNRASVMPPSSDTDTTSRCASCGVPRNFGTTCKYCGTVYPDAASKLHPDQDLPDLHEKYTVTKDGGGVSISVPIRKTVDVVIVAFIGIFAFLIIVLFFAFSGPIGPSGSPAQFTIIPLVFKSIVGGGTTLFAVLCWFNRVTIQANSRYLTLRHHPIPLQLSMKIRTEDMTDLSVVARRKTHNDQTWNVPVLRVSTVTGNSQDVMVGRSEADFGDFDVLKHHLSKALAP